MFDPDTALCEKWVMHSGQRLGGRGPPNYGIIPKWELSPNYPAFGIIFKLSSNCRIADSRSRWSYWFSVMKSSLYLVSIHYLLLLALVVLEMQIIGCWISDYGINMIMTSILRIGHSIGRGPYSWPGVRLSRKDFGCALPYILHLVAGSSCVKQNLYKFNHPCIQS